MWNSVTGTVEASSGRASQRKTWAGLDCCNTETRFFFFFFYLLPIFLFTVCLKLRQPSASFQSRAPSVSPSSFTSPSPGGPVRVTARQPRRPQCSPDNVLPVQSRVHVGKRHHDTEEPPPPMLQGAAGWNVGDGFRLRLFYFFCFVPVCIYRGTGGRPELHINHKWQQPSCNIYIFI